MVWVERDPNGHSIELPCSEQGHPLLQSLVEPELEYLQG